MSSFSQKDIQLLFVGAAATKTTGAIAAMNDGEIGIFTPAGARVTEATAATVDKFIIVKKTANGGIPLVSSVIKKADIKKATRTVYSAAVDQVNTIGYDGSSGAIEAVSNNDYHIRISLRANYVDNHGGLYLKHAFYTSDSSATEYEIASNLLLALDNEFLKEPERVLKAEMLCNDAGVATTGTVSVVKGSKTITTTVPGDFAVGGLVRLGTATTAAVYKINSIVGSVITLDSPVTATTQTFAIAAAESVSAANAIAASFGIKMTGIASTHVTGKLHGDLLPRYFDVTVENFRSTPAVLVTKPYAGTGTQTQVQELEWFCQGNEGDFYRIGEPNLFPKRAEATGNYDLIHLTIQELYTGSMITNPVHKTYTLAIPETAPNYAVTGTADDITDVLEVLVYGATNGTLAVS
jgi:ribosomal protein L23